MIWKKDWLSLNFFKLTKIPATILNQVINNEEAFEWWFIYILEIQKRQTIVYRLKSYGVG